jgi:hypothetical protein
VREGRPFKTVLQVTDGGELVLKSGSLGKDQEILRIRREEIVGAALYPGLQMSVLMITTEKEKLRLDIHRKDAQKIFEDLKTNQQKP